MKFVRGEVFMLGCLMTTIAMGGCSNVAQNPDSVSSTFSTNQPMSTVIATEPADQVTKDRLTKLTFTDQQKKDILRAAQEIGLKKVFIPVFGAGPDDYLDKIEVEGNVLILNFVRQAIAQSSEEIKLHAKAEGGKEVKLSDETTGEWIPEEKGSSVKNLYFKLDKTYIEYYSSKPFFEERFEASARSMIPLE